MEKIKFNDINFDSLQKLKQQGTKGIMYKNGVTCYKILDGLYEDEKEEIYKKFIDLDGIKIENVLLPKELIMKDGKLYGYTMDYFDNSVSLSDKFCVRYVNVKELFSYVYKASKILREIHKNDIICQDLSFENILVDENGNVVFCDLDGCSYKRHFSPFISVLMENFFVNYRNEKIPLSFNLDRISMMLSFYYLIYIKEIQHLTKRQYHKLSDKIITLENARKYANVLVDKENIIGQIPYLDELIDSNDDYIYDRKKQLSLVNKIVKK